MLRKIEDIPVKSLIVRWENCLRVLQRLTPHERRNHWDMSFFGRKNACGTVACAAGHCGLDPWFRRRGFTLRFNSEGQDIMDGGIVETFFGYKGTNKIFFNSTHRPVRTVIREVKNHIKWLQQIEKISQEKFDAFDEGDYEYGRD